MPDTANTARHGVVCLLKPPGMTSHDAVAHLRRVLKIKRVGHTGTLDPAASGVLSICVGQATRLVETLQMGGKEYLAEATFGYETDTLDATGQTLHERDASSITRRDVERACEEFLGETEQEPPMYSAIKIGGRKLYDIARSDEQTEGLTGDARRAAQTDIPWRSITISALQVTHFVSGERPRASLRIECSGGTYIRSLVRDIGNYLGNVATMTFLSRTRNGQFFLNQSVTPQEFENTPRVKPLQAVLSELYGDFQFDDENATALWQGKTISSQFAPQQQHRNTDQISQAVWSNSNQTLLCVARLQESTLWKPEKVFDLRAESSVD